MAAVRNSRMTRGRTPLRLIRGGRPVIRPRTLARPQVRYKRVGHVGRASNAQFNFTVTKIRDTNTKTVNVLIERYNRFSKKDDWRIMTIAEYNKTFARKKGKESGKKIEVLTTSATMLAKHPDVFTHIGHEVAKNLIHVLMAA